MLTHFLGKHRGDCQSVHPLSLAGAVLAVDFSQTAGFDATAQQLVKVLAACRDFLLLANFEIDQLALSDCKKDRTALKGNLRRLKHHDPLSAEKRCSSHA